MILTLDDTSMLIYFDSEKKYQNNLVMSNLYDYICGVVVHLTKNQQPN
jgi:hypothetical protein